MSIINQNLVQVFRIHKTCCSVHAVNGGVDCHHNDCYRSSCIRIVPGLQVILSRCIMEQESTEKDIEHTNAVRRRLLESQEEPISVIREETEEELKANDVTRPLTSKGRLQTHFPQQSRPLSSKNKYPRPGSTRSQGSSRPGTGSRKVCIYILVPFYIQ